MDKLPNEIIYLILSKLEPIDLINYSCVCKLWLSINNEIIDSENNKFDNDLVVIVKQKYSDKSNIIFEKCWKASQCQVLQGSSPIFEPKPLFTSYGVSYIGIASIPKHINVFNNLKEISFVRGLIEEISIGLCKMTQLISLDLSHNKIKIVPNEIGNLTNLERLHLGYNLIEVVPNSIDNLKKLKYCQLKNNKIKEFSKTIIQNNPNIIYWLEGNKLDLREYLHYSNVFVR